MIRAPWSCEGIQAARQRDGRIQGKMLHPPDPPREVAIVPGDPVRWMDQQQGRGCRIAVCQQDQGLEAVILMRRPKSRRQMHHHRVLESRAEAGIMARHPLGPQDQAEDRQEIAAEGEAIGLDTRRLRRGRTLT